MRPITFLLTIIIGIGVAGLQPPLAAQAQPGPEPTVIQADEAGLTLEWQPPPVEITTVEAAGVTYSRLTVPGLSPLNRPGAPQLPTFGRLIGLPPDSGATLTLTSLELDTLALPAPPLPAPTPQPISFEQAQSLTGGAPVTIAPDAAIYSVDALFPAPPATLEPPQQVRGYRMARLAINPVRVNPVTRQAVVIRRIRLEIRFDAPAAPSLATQSQPDAFSGALAATLLNPLAAGWAAPVRPAAGSEPVPPLLDTAAAVAPLKVVVNQAGLYRLTYAELQAAGWPVESLNPQSLQMNYGAEFAPVAILVEGEADASFDPGDRILFVASPTFSRYTDEDVYFLSADAAAPPRIATRSGNPQGLPSGTAWRTATAESSSPDGYEPYYPDHRGDRWYWKRLAQPGASLNAAISVNNPNSAGSDATLTAWLQGYTSGNHTVRVRVNGQLAAAVTWSDKTQKAAQVSVPAGWLLAGSNTINFELTSLSGVLVDAVELRYPTASGGSGQVMFAGDAGPQAYSLGNWASNQLHVLDVTTPLTPAQVTGFTLTPSGGKYSLTVGHADAVPRDYLVAPDSALKAPLRLEPARLLSDPGGGADMIIITHPDFAGAVAPLAAHRAGQGLRVFTVDVTAVYDTFGGGRLSPQAIRAFLQHAYHNWPAPLYVLLVGDGAYDFKNYSGFNPQNFIPPNLAQVDPWLGETASDNRLVNFDVENLPSMFIGRLPVNSPAQAETVVNKIIQYDTNPSPGSWNTRHLLVAGDSLKNPNDSDPNKVAEYNQETLGFHTAADQADKLIPASSVAHRFYFKANADLINSPDYIYNNYITLRNDFINAFNQGASTVVFLGHSSVHQWNDEPLLRWSKIAADNDVNRLINGSRLPVVLALTCFTGSFHHPEYPTLDESLLTRSGGGAVATWGSTGLGVATGHALLQQGFYTSISSKNTNLGAAVFAGKSTLYAGSLWDRDLIDTFTLLGDPAMNVNLTERPFTDFLYLPVVASDE